MASHKTSDVTRDVTQPVVVSVQFLGHIAAPSSLCRLILTTNAPHLPSQHTIQNFTTLTAPDDKYKSHCSSQSSNIDPSYMSSPSYPVHCTALIPDNQHKSHCSSQSSSIHPIYMPSPSYPVHCTALTPDNQHKTHCSSQLSNIHPSYTLSPSYPVHCTTLTPDNLYKSVPKLVKKFDVLYGTRSMKIRVFRDATFCRWASTS
jgi:hypothetical protein